MAATPQYREYLDPAFRDDFDAWREKYRNPYKDLKDTDLRIRNWDTERRWSDQQRDGVVGEVLFPNTIPPFFPSFVLFAAPPSPEDYAHRRAGIHAHNRWLADFVAEHPHRRAGIGQIFLNDIDDAIEDVRWIKEHDLRGGILVPNIPPDVKWIKPLHHPDYDPLWAVCEELGVPVSSHGGTGTPEYAKTPASAVLMIAEVPFYSQRPLVQIIMGGVFQRFPRLKFVVTEAGCAWVPGLLKRLDYLLDGIRKNGAIGELRFSPDMVLPLSATEYFQRNVWMGVSQPTPEDAAALVKLGGGPLHVGQRLSPRRGTGPSAGSTSPAVPRMAEAELRAFLGGNAAELYDFDLAALAPLAKEFGPDAGRARHPAGRSARAPERGAAEGRASLTALLP